MHSQANIIPERNMNCYLPGNCHCVFRGNNKKILAIAMSILVHSHLQAFRLGKKHETLFTRKFLFLGNNKC